MDHLRMQRAAKSNCVISIHDVINKDKGMGMEPLLPKASNRPIETKLDRYKIYYVYTNIDIFLYRNDS